MANSHVALLCSALQDVEELAPPKEAPLPIPPARASANPSDRSCEHSAVDTEERETASEIVTNDVEIFVKAPQQAEPSHRPQVQDFCGYVPCRSFIGSHFLAAETAASAKSVQGSCCLVCFFCTATVPGRRHRERVAYELAKRGKLLRASRTGRRTAMGCPLL